MLAMQYAIGLPADYDMEIIRRRVATRGAAMDAFPGLGLKAYGIRCRGTDGSPVNEYAPFYLWQTVPGMRSFLLGAGFAGLSADFGRPTVRCWMGVSAVAGPARAGARPRLATRRTLAVAPDEDAQEVVATATASLAELARTPGVHTSAVGLDPQRWELVHFTLWADDAPAEAGTRYEVLHLSAPGLDGLG